MLIIIVSDSTADSGHQITNAVTSQFKFDSLEIQRRPFVQDHETIDEIFNEYLQNNPDPAYGLVAYSLVSPSLRLFAKEKGESLNVPTIDLLGPYLNQLSQITKQEPRLQPGLSHRVDLAYYKRIDAIEFAIKHDDGKITNSLNQADVVLVGVSRTSKTPLCIYLAHQSILAANIPLIPETPVPDELFLLPRQKIIGLTIRPEVLLPIRENRLREMGLQDDFQYANIERILNELDYGKEIMRRIGCPIIDISNRAMEETASIIMQILHRRVRG